MRLSSERQVNFRVRPSPKEAYEIRKREHEMLKKQVQALSKSASKESKERLEIMKRRLLQYDSILQGYRDQYGFD